MPKIPTRKSPVKFTTKDGTPVSFTAKKPVKVKNANELEKRLKGLHPALKKNARLCFEKGEFACASKSRKKSKKKSPARKSPVRKSGRARSPTKRLIEGK